MAGPTQADQGPTGNPTLSPGPLVLPTERGRDGSVPSTEEVDGVEIVETPPPGRSRRPMDALRLIVVGVGALLIGGIAAGTVDAAEELSVDLRHNVVSVPAWITGTISLGSGLAGLLLIIGMLGGMAFSRRLRALGESLLGGVLGALICAGTSWWIDVGAPRNVNLAFEASLEQPAFPVPWYLGFLVGLVSVQGWRGRPWVIRASLFAVIGGALTALADGSSTVQGAVVAVLLGRAGGLVVRLALGTPVQRPAGRDVARALVQADFRPVRLVESEGPTHQFVAETPTGPLSLVLLYRDQLGGGMLGRTWRLLRARDEITAHHSITLRGMADQRALIAYAFQAAGVRAPALRACLQVDSDTVMLAYEYVPEHPLTAEEATDDLQRELWRQVDLMHHAGLAHRRLGPAGIRLDQAGRPWLVERSGGQVAASELAQLTDVAQLLITLAALGSPERAVDNAVAVLGPQRVGRAHPLIQPIVLSSSGRRTLRGRGEILIQLRDLLSERGVEADGPAPELERFKPRRLVTVGALVLAVYLAGSQLADVDVLGLLSRADPVFIGVAVVACALTYLLDPPALLAFVHQRISYARAVGAQLALSFVKLIMPSTLGNAALDYRLLTKSGVASSAALAAAAASQALAFIVTVPLLLLLALFTGRTASVGITPSPTSIIVVVAVVACLGLLSLAPPVRSRARETWERFAANGLNNLLDALQDPRRVLAAVGGSLGVTFSFVTCFYASLTAVGVHNVSFAVLAVIWLTGNTIGTAIPTPGGLGAIEVALTAGLTAAGVDSAQAISGVLLFRLISFWIPIPLGWLAWNRMQRAGML